jgi:hypothetical protein
MEKDGCFTKYRIVVREASSDSPFCMFRIPFFSTKARYNIGWSRVKTEAAILHILTATLLVLIDFCPV